MPAAQRHPMIMTLRWLMPAAAVMSAALGVMAHSKIGHVGGFSFAFMLAFIAILQSRMKPVLVLDDDGYAIEQGGRRRFAVPWRDVKVVRAVFDEGALYIDCGDPARNIFVPPGRGYGFRFINVGAMFKRIQSAVGDRLVRVDTVEALRK
jgi:hypothetical protein